MIYDFGTCEKNLSHLRKENIAPEKTGGEA